ncbi:MAG TPA: septum formation initiator family protein [Bacteroidota bacterium]|jgi:cell division protein FtsL
MTRPLRDDIEVLLNRARQDSPRPHAPDEEEQSRTFGRDPQAATPGYAIRSNRRATRRKISMFSIVLMLMAFGAGTVFYISNVITVNRLAVEVGDLRTKLEKAQNTNAGLHAEINQKSSWDRIGKIATEELGLQYTKEQPGFFNIDQEKLEELNSPQH